MWMSRLRGGRSDMVPSLNLPGQSMGVEFTSRIEKQ